jgi:6-phosphogluconolactonase
MTKLSSTIVDSDELARVSAQWIADRLGDALTAGKKGASLSLAGGTTPREVYEALTRENVPWERVHIYFGDERCVAPDHPDSNYRMAKESLLDRVPIPPENVHRPRAEMGDRDAAARAYEEELPDILDVMVLGIGEDGHTASLFPSSPALAEETRRYLPVTGPKPPPERLTVTPVVIAAATAVIVLAKGEGKAAAVARALEGDWDPTTTPAQLARKGYWVLDTAAAGALRAPDSMR